MDSRNRIEGDYFDTVNSIEAYAPRELLEAAMEECASYHRLLSKSEKSSDVWRINHAEGKPVSVSEHTMRILRTGQEVYEASEGAFNLTVGAATSLWNFKAEKPKLPDPEAIRLALTKMEAGRIVLEEDRVIVPAGMCVDVGGIAKGYIADRVAEFLRARGVTSGLLNFGGNVITIGTKPEGEPWMIGLQKPDGVTGRDFWAAFPSADETAVTSGTYERGFTLNGIRYHHLLDPRTGWPVQNEVETVTLIGRSSLLADAVSTACFVLGPGKGIPLAARFDMKVIYRLKDGRVLLSKEVPLTLVKGA